MSPTLSLTTAFLVYSLYAWLAFNPEFKTKSWIIYAGLGCALVCNLLWILLAKATVDGQRLLYYGLWWDALITVSTITVPIVLFGVRLAPLQIVGLVLAVTGLGLMKIASSN